MAAVASAADNAADLIGKLTLDATNTKANEVPEVTNKGGAVNGKEEISAPKPTAPLSRDYTSFFPNGYPTTAIYYGGYDGSTNEMEGYSRYVSPEGVEMPQLGVYGDVYHHGYGYGAYGAYSSPGSPIPTIGHDGQLYGSQYATAYYQPPTPTNGPYTPISAPTSQGEVSTSVAADQPPISVDISKVKSNGLANGNTNGRSSSAPSKQNQNNSSLNSNGVYGGFPTSGHLSSYYQDPRYGFSGIQSPVSWYDGAMFYEGQHRQATNNGFSTVPHVRNNSTHSRNQNYRHLPHLMRPTTVMAPGAPGLASRMYPNRMYTNFGTNFRTGFGSGSNFYDSRANGRWVVAEENKYKPRGRVNGLYAYGNENLDGLSELNRGPRAGHFKDQKSFGPTITVTGPDASTNKNIENSGTEIDKDKYNRDDFLVEYSDAKFFIIKSYSEDDVHRSIKYDVWASTPNGNKKLDGAYREAQLKTSGCPVFLLFSVNTSGQFVGMAEMMAPVDFDKTVDYWQQDKWTGCFPVKWHIVKDVPNNILKHITLENNDNKPVTNSRDTQEVKLEQGLQMLKLFKEHVSKTSIMDDFSFYETRQKAMQENRAKYQLLQKQVADLKPLNSLENKEKDAATAKLRFEKPLESFSVLKREVQAPLVERKPSDDNAAAAVMANGGESLKITKPDTNGVANGC